MYSSVLYSCFDTFLTKCRNVNVLSRFLLFSHRAHVQYNTMELELLHAGRCIQTNNYKHNLFCFRHCCCRLFYPFLVRFMFSFFVYYYLMFCYKQKLNFIEILSTEIIRLLIYLKFYVMTLSFYARMIFNFIIVSLQFHR